MATSKEPKLASFLCDASRLADCLHALAESNLEPGQYTMQQAKSTIPKLLNKDFGKVMIPTTKNMNIMLPSNEVSKKDHYPFPGPVSYFHR